jgi:hypothetical protein
MEEKTKEVAGDRESTKVRDVIRANWYREET